MSTQNAQNGDLLDTCWQEGGRCPASRPALARRKAEGQRLGRPPGSPNRNRRLDGHDEEIRAMIDAGETRVDIARRFGVCYKTIYRWERRPFIPEG